MTYDRLLAEPGSPVVATRIPGLHVGHPQPASSRRLGWLSFVAVLALAAALRIPGITRFILEQDEIYTFYEATKLFRTQLRPGIEARPLYYLFQHALFWVVPPTVVWMRLPPLVFGLLGIALTWWTARRIFGLTAATVAGVLVAVSPWHMHVSGMARYWSLSYLLSAAFLFAIVQAYTGGRARDYRLACVAAVLGSATHPTFLFTVAGVALGLCLSGSAPGERWRWPSRDAWLNLWLPYGAFLGVAAVALRLTRHDGAVQNWGGRGWSASVRLVPAITEWAGASIVAAGFAGALILALRSRSVVHRRWGWAAILGCATTVALLAAASFRTDVYADYAIAMLPLVFVSAGALVQLVGERAGEAARPIEAAVALIICVGTLPYTVSHLIDGTRFDYRPLFRYVNTHQPRLPVLTWPLVVQRVYAPRLDGRDLRTNTRYLDARLQELGSFWLIASYRRYGMVDDADGSVQSWMRRHCSFATAHERLRFDDRRYRAELHLCAERPPR